MKYDLSLEAKLIYDKLKSNTVDALISESGYNEIENEDSRHSMIKIDHHYNDLLRVGYLSSIREITSTKPSVRKLVIFVKKTIRKLTKWYVEPICMQQTEFNINVERIIKEQKAIQEQMLLTIQKLQKDRQMDLAEKAASAKTQRELEEKIKSIEEFCLQDKGKSESLFNKKTYSQSGEDSIIAYILSMLGKPFDQCTYLDLGANHARDMSNTYFFYTHGARGVLVEANPHLISELNQHRKDDKIVNKCVTVNSGDTIQFYVFNGDGLSTPDFDKAQEFLQKNSNLKIIDTVHVDTISINDLIKNYLHDVAPVLLNIDIEGEDINILRSLDIKRYRPMVIITEMINYKPELVIDDKNEEILNYLRSNNYVEYAFTGINSIFIDRNILTGKGV